MSYRERAVETVKMMAQDLLDRADELIPDAKKIKEVNIWLRIPTLTDDIDNLPEIQVNVDVYPSKQFVDVFLKQQDE